MIARKIETLPIGFDGFRLLNSEIGNDQMNIKTIETIFTRFRLLNSEIGNDQRESLL